MGIAGGKDIRVNMAEVLSNVLKTTHPRSQSSQHRAQEEKRTAPARRAQGRRTRLALGALGPGRASMRGAAVSPARLATGADCKVTVRGAGPAVEHARWGREGEG